MTDSLRGATALVGVAESDLGEVGPNRFAVELAAQASQRALAEAGLTKNDVDGLFTQVSGRAMSSLALGEYMGIRPRYSDSTAIGGSSLVSYIHHAAIALQAGKCDVALIAYGSTNRSDMKHGRAGVRPADRPNYETAYRPRGQMSGYALAAARHMYQYGTTRRHLAEIAVAARRWAQLNPKAFVRTPLTIEDALAKPMISTPFSSLDCCLVTDGGGALVLTRADRARDLPAEPIYVLGTGEAHWHWAINQMPDLTVSAATDSSARAFAMAGLGPSDIDVVELYDAFTINPIIFLEDMGFCPRGEGGNFVSDGRTGPGGDFPMNTNGGGLSYCHPGMYGIFPVIEAVRQLRGEAGERQVNTPTIALAHGNGGQLSSEVTAILGRAAAL